MELNHTNSEADDSLEEGEIPSPKSKNSRGPISEFYETISELSEEETKRRPVCRRRSHRRRRSRTRARTRPRTHTLRDRRMNDFDEMRKRYLERLKENRRRQEDIQRVAEQTSRKESVKETHGAGVEDMDIEESMPFYPVYEVSSQESEPHPTAGSSHDTDEEIDLHHLRALALSSQRNRVAFAGNESDSGNDSPQNEFFLRAEALKTAMIKKGPSIRQKKETVNKAKDRLKESIENQKNVQANQSGPIPEAKKPTDDGVGKENKIELNEAVEDENVLREMLLANLPRKDADVREQQGNASIGGLIEISNPQSEATPNNSLTEPSVPSLDGPAPPRRPSEVISELIQAFGESELSPDLSVEPDFVYSTSIDRIVKTRGEKIDATSKTITLSKPKPKVSQPSSNVAHLGRSTNTASKSRPELDMFSDSFDAPNSVQNAPLSSAKTDLARPNVSPQTLPSASEKPQVSKSLVPIPSVSQTAKWTPGNQVVSKKQTVRSRSFRALREIRKRETKEYLTRRRENSKENVVEQKTITATQPSPNATFDKMSTPGWFKPALQKLTKTVANLSKRSSPMPANEPTNKKARNGKVYHPLVVSKVMPPVVDQRIVIRLGNESSDDESEDTKKDCSKVDAATLSAVDDFLLKARLQAETNIPSTPEAVRSHLSPAQRLEYAQLKQKLAEKEKISGNKVEELKPVESPGSPALNEITITCQNTRAAEPARLPCTDQEDLRALLKSKRRNSNEDGSSGPKMEEPGNPPAKSSLVETKPPPLPKAVLVPQMIRLKPVTVVSPPMRAPVRSRHKFVNTASKESIELAKIGQLMAVLKRELAAENAARDALARLRQEIIVIEQKKLEHSNRSTMLRARIKKLLGPAPSTIGKSSTSSAAAGSMRIGSSPMIPVNSALVLTNATANSKTTTVVSSAVFGSTTRSPMASPKKVTSIKVPTPGVSPGPSSPYKTMSAVHGSRAAPSVTAASNATTALGPSSPVESSSPHAPATAPQPGMANTQGCQHKTANASCSTSVTTMRSCSPIVPTAGGGGSPSHASEAPKEVDRPVKSAEEGITPSKTAVPKNGFANYVSPLVSLVSALDPMRELCPHDLTGVCRDDSCQYQHFRV